MIIKRIILIVYILVIGLKGFCFAEEKKDLDYQHAITVNPFGLVFGVFNFQYQYKIKNDANLALRGLYWGFSTSDWKWSSFGAGVVYRFNLSKKGLTGFYVAPIASCLYISAEYSGSASTTIFFSPAGEFGYQWIWNRFTLDLNTGIRYNIGNLIIGDKDFPHTGFGWPGLGVNFGWALY